MHERLKNQPMIHRRGCTRLPAVHLGTVAKFNKMKKLAKGDWALLAEALQTSTALVRPFSHPRSPAPGYGSAATVRRMSNG